MFYKPFFVLRCFIWICILPLVTWVMPGCAAQNATLQSNANSKLTALQITAQSNVSIVLPARTIPSEETAAKELQHYITQITGANPQIIRENGAVTVNGPVIYVGPTQFANSHLTRKSTFDGEEWLMQTVGNSLILTGGRPRGTLYAAYHFLEDVCGVHWWNPWAESVPKEKILSIPALDKRSKPAFDYRDIYALYVRDNGRFMARSRLNRQGDALVGAEYGGSHDYGPPYHVHTFYKYISPEVYHDAHPDWFTAQDGKNPTVSNSQLAMSNPGMRQEFLKLLLENIRNSRKDAIAKHLPPPNVYDVSQNDNGVGFVGAADEPLAKANGGVVSAILLDFINYLADGIKDEFPDVAIETLAYGITEKPPTHMTASDNVIIRLTDTKSNLILPITAERNTDFRENIEAWSKVSKHLWVWDYGVTYGYPGLPIPTDYTYPIDIRFWKAHNVTGIFEEHEQPILGDMRDMKLWLQCKLFENPDLDDDTLVREFTEGFYGPAGKYVREYRTAMLKEAERVGKEKGYEDITWFVPAKQFNYLSLEFLIRAGKILDEAAKAAGSDEMLQQRVRHARMPLDRFITLFYSEFEKDWAQHDKSPQKFPFDRTAIAKRYYQSWDEQIDMRLPEAERAAARSRASAEVSRLAGLRTVPIPAKFRDIAPEKIITFLPGALNLRFAKTTRIIPDKESESGVVARYPIPDPEVEHFKVPLPWGVRDDVAKKTNFSGFIQREDILGAAFHWYKLGDIQLTGHDFLWLPWSWQVQNVLDSAYDPKHPDAKYALWINLKFEGPAFPYGKADDDNALLISQIVLVKE